MRTRHSFRDAYSPALKVVACDDHDGQFSIENDTPSLDDWDRQYVHVGGYFGEHSPHTFAEAPNLLKLLRRWAALDGGYWHAERHSREKEALMAETRALISKAEGLGS